MTDRVENMVSNKGNKIANQFVIYTDNGSIFQSYNSTIVKLDSGKTYLDINKWNYSKTTGKYRNIFLNETKKDYIKFAKLLRSINVKFDKVGFTLNFNDLYNGLIEIFKNDNPRFDEIRFKNYIRNK